MNYLINNKHHIINIQNSQLNVNKDVKTIIIIYCKEMITKYMKIVNLALNNFVNNLHMKNIN